MSKHEPVVLCIDVADLIRPYADKDNGEAAAMLAGRAGCSIRTLWRVLGCETPWISLKRADDLLVAVGESLLDCRLIHPDRSVEYNGDIIYE